MKTLVRLLIVEKISAKLQSQKIFWVLGTQGPGTLAPLPCGGIWIRDSPPLCRKPCAQNSAIFEENFLPCLDPKNVLAYAKMQYILQYYS